MINKIKNLEFLKNLIHVRRYSGLLLLKDESVSDHICCMNQLALAVVPEINKRISKYNKTYKNNLIEFIDLKDVIYRISVHDLDEALTLDFPRPIKYANPQITKAIYKTVQDILKKYLKRDLINDINNAKNYKYREGYLVSLFDLVQAGLKMQQEIELGNKIFKKEIVNVIKLMEEKLYKIDDFNYDDIFIESVKEILNDYIIEFKEYAQCMKI